jgi:hypothetical protein
VDPVHSRPGFFGIPLLTNCLVRPSQGCTALPEATARMLPLLAICSVVMDSEISQPEISDCERSNFFTVQRLKESGCGLGFVAVSITQDALCLHLCIILSLASERTIYGPA